MGIEWLAAWNVFHLDGMVRNGNVTVHVCPTVYKTKPMVFVLAVTHVLQLKCISTVVLSKTKGKNLLYFGCRHKAKDFLYRDELRKFLSKLRHTFLFLMIVRTIIIAGKIHGVKFCRRQN